MEAGRVMRLPASAERLAGDGVVTFAEPPGDVYGTGSGRVGQRPGSCASLESGRSKSKPAGRWKTRPGDPPMAKRKARSREQQVSLDATFSGISWHGVTGNRRAVPPQARCRGSYEHICVDLMDAAHCRAQLSHLTDVTRFLCRVRGRSRPRGTGEPEFDPLRNLVETIEPVAVDLQHIHFMQGSSHGSPGTLQDSRQGG